MRIDRSGLPFIGTAVGAAALFGILGWTGWSLASIAAAAFFTFFFRDPARTSPAIPCAVLSPADGRVLRAGDAEPQAAPPGQWRQVSIFLSPLDVHVNRVPVSGRITRIEYRPGRYLPAYRREAAAANERNEIWIDCEGQFVVCRQVVGILARRLVSRVVVGQQVVAGDRFGIMKFGSRFDVFLPPTAMLRVSTGDYVRGGETVLATLC